MKRYARSEANVYDGCRWFSPATPIAALNCLLPEQRRGGWFYLIPGCAYPGAAFVVAHVCARLCAHGERFYPLTLASLALSPSRSRSRVPRSCVIRRVPQRCITEWRESRRNALPAHKSRHATSPVCRITCAHATRLLSLSLSFYLPGPYGRHRCHREVMIKTRCGDTAAPRSYSAASRNPTLCSWSATTRCRPGR